MSLPTLDFDNVFKFDTFFFPASTSSCTLILFSFFSFFAGPSDSVGPEPSVGVVKEPVITSQPPLKMNIVVGEELRLVVEVEGEEPIK